MKALVLFSGGLDSIVAVKLLEEKGYKIEKLFFKLPFSCCNFNDKGAKLKIIDCTSGKLFQEYLEIIKNPKHGTGTGINPCRDCKIFMFKKAKEYADKNGFDAIATGEVLGQRPMSQTRQALNLIDRKLGFEIKRPLIELGISGRKRTRQMELAEKFNVKYPTPAGGCLLCEKIPSARIKFLLDRNLINEKTLPLTRLSRHYWIDEWFVAGKNEKENAVIEDFAMSLKSGRGKPAVYYQNNKKTAEKIQVLFENKKQMEINKFKI